MNAPDVIYPSPRSLAGAWPTTPRSSREHDYRLAMRAIARGRAALAHPLPPPRFDTPYLHELRMERSRLFVACHTARGGRWS